MSDPLILEVSEWVAFIDGVKTSKMERRAEVLLSALATALGEAREDLAACREREQKLRQAVASVQHHLDCIDTSDAELADDDTTTIAHIAIAKAVISEALSLEPGKDNHE